MAKDRKTGGRVAGTPNKVTTEISEAAQAHGPECIEMLMAIARTSRSPQATSTSARDLSKPPVKRDAAEDAVRVLVIILHSVESNRTLELQLGHDLRRAREARFPVVSYFS